MKKKETLTVSISKDLYDTINDFNPMNKSVFIEELLYYGLDVYAKKTELMKKINGLAIENIDLNKINFNEILKPKK